MHIGCKINREKRFPGCVLDLIKIRILQLYPCNPAPQHRRGDCLARRLTSWPRTTRPLRPSAKLSSGPHSDAPSPASRTTRERPSFFSATAIADAMSRRFALAAAARSWRARPAPRHVHLHSLYASPRSQLTHATPRLAPCSTGQGHCHCRPSPPLARSAAGVMRRARSALSVGIRGLGPGDPFSLPSASLRPLWVAAGAAGRVDKVSGAALGAFENSESLQPYVQCN